MLKSRNVRVAPAAFALVLALSAVLLAFAFRAAAEDAASPIVADVDAGAEIYNSVCKGCHGVAIAPTLRGIIGRPIASVESFTGYSEALKARKSLTWTQANLDAFLKSAAEFAPGTLMTQAIPEAQKRADIIAYLATLPPPR